MNTQVIAIDGSAGCGKSTVTKLIASKFNLNYIDTGALFRALAWHMDKRQVQSENDIQLELDNISIEYLYQNSQLKISLNSIDISNEIRLHHVSQLASTYSKEPLIRNFVKELEREIVNSSSQISILEGRDIGTVIFPHARLKIFLWASSTVRAKRRFIQLKENKTLGSLSLEEIEKDIQQRDHQDQTRAIAPLKKADDAIEIDTSEMSIDEVVIKISEHVEKIF